jgi:DHA2 family multidrug resistance protein
MAVGLSSLIYVLEEGQRKDWFGSPLIQTAGVLAVVFLTFFTVWEFFAKHPLVNLRLFGERNFGLGSLANIVLGAALYGSVYLLPIYLATTQGYSASQIGQVLIWSGLPQLAITPFLPVLMRKFDPRFLICFGFAMFACSCLMNAFMSHDYAGPQLVVSMVVRALGQPFILTPLAAVATIRIQPAQAGSASALFNMMRNLGGSIGTAVASTLVIQREQFHSARLGEHVTLSDAPVREWLANAAQNLHHAGASHWVAQQQALNVLGSKIREEAYVMAFNDAFTAVAIILFLAMVTVLFLRKPTGQLNTAVE